MSQTITDIERVDEFSGEDSSSGSIERFLTFTSDNITFGVSTNNVIEIITSYKIRPLPMVPDYIRGIINLRGQVVPVIDIRLRMGRPLLEYTDSTCIIILSIGETSVGITVDFVAQVLDIDREDICPIPVSNRQELSSSMIHLKDGSVVLFLDCEQLIRQY